MSSFQGSSQPYEQKLEKLQRYLPFLRKMITKLERTHDPARAAQLQKMKHLLGILTDSSRKLKYELLVKCEEVLQKLHDKIEGESDDDVMEVPRPPEPPRHLLYPESEWERPSPPRDTQNSTPSSSGMRPVDDIPTHSPPLSSFVERISMSSPTNFNDMDQPRSPSPEVVAQIPGAFAGGDREDKKFERGREILRKLMVGMSKTLDETGVESPSEMDSQSKGPKIIPLERTSSETPDTEPPADDEEDCVAGSNSSNRPAVSHSAVVSDASDHGDAYNPEDEWGELRKKPAFMPSFMVKPPLSKEDLEELNRDLGTGTSSEKVRSQEAERQAPESHRTFSERRWEAGGKADGDRREKTGGSRSEERGHSTTKNRVVKKGETLAEAQRRQFEDWKRAEIEKCRERRKKQKAEMKHSSHSRTHHDPAKSSSHAHKRHQSGDHASSHRLEVSSKSKSPSKSGAGVKNVSGKDMDRSKTSSVIDAAGEGTSKAGLSKDPRMKSTMSKESAKKIDPTLEKVSEQLKKYSVQDLMKTVQQTMSPVAKKDVPVNDLDATYRCLLIRNLPPKTLRQDIFRFFQGFGMVELVLEVDFSFACTGIAYAQLVDHAEAKRAKQELAEKTVHGKGVKIAPCADAIFKEAKRTYEQDMNAREDQYAKRQNIQSQPAPVSPTIQYPRQPQPPMGYQQQQYPSHVHGVRSLRPPHVAGMGFGPRPPAPGLLGYSPQHASQLGLLHHHPRFPQHGGGPRNQAPARPPPGKHNFYNPYDAQPGQAAKHLPSKDDPRRAAKMTLEEQKKQKLEKELEILRRHKEERDKRKQLEKPARNNMPLILQKPVSKPATVPQSSHKAASLGSFKIPKLKRPDSVEESVAAKEDPEPLDKTESGMDEKQPMTCHQEDTVSSTVDTDDLLGKKKRKRTRLVVMSDSDSESEAGKSTVSKASGVHVQTEQERPERSDGDVAEETEQVEAPKERRSSRRLGKAAERTKGKEEVRENMPAVQDQNLSEEESEEERCQVGRSEASDKADDVTNVLAKKPVLLLTRARTNAERAAMANKSEVKVDETTGSDTLGNNLAETSTTDVTDVLSPDVEAPVASTDSNVKSSMPVPEEVVKKNEKEPRIEPDECEYCPYSGKKVIRHYVVSHPGKPISVRLNKEALETTLGEELGPSDDSARAPLSQELENKLMNDDLSWIPPSLMFDDSVACLYCKFTALNKRHMLQHIADHLQTGTSAPEQYSIKCRFCKVKSVSTHEMFDHISSHTGEYRYSCRYCGYRVFRMYFLKVHMANVHKGCQMDNIAIEEVDIGNGWVYGYACKLCGFVQLHERNVKKHMNDCHAGSLAYAKVNMSTKGPPIDISKKVSDALKRRKAEDEKRAAAQPPPIQDMDVFVVGEEWLNEESNLKQSRKADMDALLARHVDRLALAARQDCSKFMAKLENPEETPMEYLEIMRKQRLLERAKSEDQVSQEVEKEEEEKKNDIESDAEGSEFQEEGEESPIEVPPLALTLQELKSAEPSDTSEFGYQVTLKLARALRLQSMGSKSEPGAAAANISAIAVKQEPLDVFSAESDARATEGLNSMTDDLESLMNDFDQFEQEQQSRPKLRIRKLSGDMLSSDDTGAGTGLMISSVMSLTGGSEADPGLSAGAGGSAGKAAELFSFPPGGERRPWKYFLTLKDQSKVMRLMFHMHHKSAYKCNAVHCSLTTNNGTLFKLHLRNHEKCDVCAPNEAAYTCMNTRLVCVYCGYKGDDLA
ncbi:uncharacterized protein LOC119111076 [Pollicipes pollicipes]|nr:uncharacterized protein LOC119111076 [Pollicipes pollicipes]